MSLLPMIGNIGKVKIKTTFKNKIEIYFPEKQ